MDNYKNTVLIIEDEPDIRDLLEFHLKKEGYNLLTSSDGEDGLNLARNPNSRVCPSIFFVSSYTIISKDLSSAAAS